MLVSISIGPAHPRSRGENGGRWFRWPSRVGSSPLTRGKPALPWTPSLLGRLIPAHAGKTLRVILPPHVCRAHPRSRGENRRLQGHRRGGRGSSLLTRGKPDDSYHEYRRVRLIPAHAGKTVWSVFQLGDPSAHPRSRGENRTVRMVSPPQAGSSPLTRGKPTLGIALIYPPRLIPAHAGKTWSFSIFLSVFGAHPRSRGENAPHSTHADAVDGSSPLTRGKLPWRP